MKAIVVRQESEGTAGMKIEEVPMPTPAMNEVVVKVMASGYTVDELYWPSTWVDRKGKDRTPSIPGHEMAGVVTEIGYGTTGFSIGQRVFGLADWYRDGSLAEYITMEVKNLAPLPGYLGFDQGASVVMSGLTAYQGLFDHGHLKAGESVLILGAAGVVGQMAVQLARDAGAYVIGAGRAHSRKEVLQTGANAYVDLATDELEKLSKVDLVFDMLGGEILTRAAASIRKAGRLVTVTGPTEAKPEDGAAIDFIVEANPWQLTQIATMIRDGRIKPVIGQKVAFKDSLAVFTAKEKIKGKLIVSLED